MNIGAGLIIEQKQSMRINQAQLQRLEILQMSQIELEEKIRDELMENPVLEISDHARDDDDSVNEQSEQDGNEAEPYKDLQYDSYDDHDYWDADIHHASGSSDRGISDFEEFYRTEETLTEHLLKQLGGTDCPDAVRRAAGYIIYSLSSNGYLDTELSEIALMASCSSEEAEKGLELVHSLSPRGVGARSVEECLCLQLDPNDEISTDVEAVIRGYLSQIAKGNIKAVTGALGISADRLVRIIERIRLLDPNPCSQFGDNMPVQYMTPDVYAEKSGDEIEVYLAGSQPRLYLSSYYLTLVKNSTDKDVKEYLRERIEKASRLIQSIDQRNRTVLRVSGAIMRHQGHIIEEGMGKLRPLTMQDIADELEISVSTVSRAVSGKNIYCNGRTYALKRFFTSEVGGRSRDSIIERIRSLISEEDPRHPLSDQKIADILMKEGFEVSRRTVAKYRDNEGILPTTMRKERH